MKRITRLVIGFWSMVLCIPAAHADGTCNQDSTTCTTWQANGRGSIAMAGVSTGGGGSYGVQGVSHGQDVNTAGVSGFSDFGNGVKGTATTTGLNGVQGDASSSGASGVYGVNHSGHGFGVAGRAAGDGIAIFGDQLAGGWAGYFNGGVFTTFSYQSSDARLKKDVNDLRYGLGEVLKLRPVSFKWKNRSDNRTQLGLIAQEVQPVIPELVTTAHVDGNDTLAVSYTSLVPILIKAVQQQQAIIEKQEARIAALEQGRAPQTRRPEGAGASASTPAGASAVAVGP